MRPKHYWAKQLLFFYPLMAIILIFIMFPLYWTIRTAFMHEGDIVTLPIRYFPNPFTITNFTTAWDVVGFNMYFRNSLFVAVISVSIITFFSIFVGYSLSRFKFKGKNVFMFMMLATQFLPAAMLILPLFMIFRSMSLLNNHFSLVIINTTMQLSFNSILMRGFVSGIPVELEEAASIDGCSRIGAIFKTVIPLLIPGLVATAAFSFVGVWNEFLYAFMFMTSRTNFTLPIGLRAVIGEYTVNHGILAAGSMIALVPALLMFVYLQKYLVTGLAAGSVKG